MTKKQTFAGFDGSEMRIEIANGVYAVATTVADNDHGAPWDNEDGHGPVEKVRRSHADNGKRPGQRVMWQDRFTTYLYDMQAATKQAKLEGWGITGDTTGMTRGQIIAKAVEQDFAFLSGYLNDDWSYVGVIVKIEDEDGEELACDALYGVESNAGEYLADVAADCLANAESGLHAKIAEKIEMHKNKVSRLTGIAESF